LWRYLLSTLVAFGLSVNLVPPVAIDRTTRLQCLSQIPNKFRASSELPRVPAGEDHTHGDEYARNDGQRPIAHARRP
jgi:hypothetical protein